MNKKLASELAIGIVLLVAIAIGIVFWLQTPKAQAPAPQVATEKTVPVQQVSTQQTNEIANPQQVETDVPWKLVSGSEKDTCTSPTWEGSVTVHGWYVYDVSYVEKEWLLRISDQDLQKFPWQGKDGKGSMYAKEVKIMNPDAEIVAKLKSATKENPAEITINGFKIYCEGVPVVYIDNPVFADQKELRKNVSDVVDEKLKEKYKDIASQKWDKIVYIQSVDASKRAARGYWLAGDAWDWIAWQQNNGQWKILLSLDGFSCEELKSVPSEFNKFFKDVIYKFRGEKYCY